MRPIFLSAFVLCILLIGCAPKEPAFAVGLYNLTNEDYYDHEDDKVKTSLSFFLMNQEPEDMDCFVLLSIDGSESITKRGKLGIVKAGTSKKGRFVIQIPEGDANIDLKPLCTPVSTT